MVRINVEEDASLPVHKRRSRKSDITVCGLAINVEFYDSNNIVRYKDGKQPTCKVCLSGVKPRD